MTFEELNELLSRDLRAFQREMSRLKKRDPDGFDAYVQRTKIELERANEDADQPLTETEVEATVGSIAESLGWSRSRVIAEAVLRLDLEHRARNFVPFTPEETREGRVGRYARRASSMTAIAMGDVGALMKKHAQK